MHSTDAAYCYTHCYVVRLSVCVSVTLMYPAKEAKRCLVYGLRWAPVIMYEMGSGSPEGKGQFWGWAYMGMPAVDIFDKTFYWNSFIRRSLVDDADRGDDDDVLTAFIAGWLFCMLFHGVYVSAANMGIYCWALGSTCIESSTRTVNFHHYVLQRYTRLITYRVRRINTKCIVITSIGVSFS